MKVSAEGSECMRGKVYQHHAPYEPDRMLFEVHDASELEIESAFAEARRAVPELGSQRRGDERQWVRDLYRCLKEGGDELARMMCEDIGKPIRHARSELEYAAELLGLNARRDDLPGDVEGQHSGVRYRAHGVIGVVTPWNNPIAVALGKIVPALLFGNAVVWKPAPQAARISERLGEMLAEAGCRNGVVQIVQGGAGVALGIAQAAGTDAITLTGSDTAGDALGAVCLQRRIPFQAELGGNNGSIVWSDADMENAAKEIAIGAFGFAGQRCTANRRVIVRDSCLERFIELFSDAVRRLGCGAPENEQTEVGPVISTRQRERIERMLEMADREGLHRIVPHLTGGTDVCVESDSMLLPTVVLCDQPDHLVVQEEMFGPVAVVQRAEDFDHAMELLNGIRQGLVASLFGGSGREREVFLQRAEAGQLKLNRSTVGAAAGLPFVGWKSSGIGPGEHGACDREFYTRTQSVYR